MASFDWQAVTAENANPAAEQLPESNTLLSLSLPFQVHAFGKTAFSSVLKACP